MAATIQDIARETGLSIATVSKYMNVATLKEKNRIAVERARLQHHLRLPYQRKAGMRSGAFPVG